MEEEEGWELGVCNVLCKNGCRKGAKPVFELRTPCHESRLVTPFQLKAALAVQAYQACALTT